MLCAGGLRIAGGAGWVCPFFPEPVPVPAGAHAGICHSGRTAGAVYPY